MATKILQIVEGSLTHPDWSEQINTTVQDAVNASEEGIYDDLQSYTRNDEFGEFRDSVNGQLVNMSADIIDNQTTLAGQIDSVQADLQAKYKELKENPNMSSVTITELFSLFGYVIDKDSSGNVNCRYVGGVE